MLLLKTTSLSYSELASYANELKITHYEDERVFDIKGLAKGPDDETEC